MAINTKFRTDQTEIMDDFALEGAVLQDALDKIAQINRLLGGNRITSDGVQKLLRGIDKTREISIVDIGCGNGDMLRFLSEFAEKKGFSVKLIGIDANAFAIKHAAALSQNYANISFRCEDIFAEEFRSFKYDIALLTLTLHHFTDDGILKLLELCIENAAVGIVVNDLQRSKLAYRLFQLFAVAFRLNEMTRSDGLISILRGFKKTDLENFSIKLGLKNYSVCWKWAFRYQWIISKKHLTS